MRTELSDPTKYLAPEKYTLDIHVERGVPGFLIRGLSVVIRTAYAHVQIR